MCAVSIVIQLFVAFNPICFVLARVLTHFASSIYMELLLSDHNIKCLLKTRIISICVNFRLQFVFGFSPLSFCVCNEVTESISFRIQISFAYKQLTSQCKTMQIEKNAIIHICMCLTTIDTK